MKKYVIKTISGNTYEIVTTNSAALLKHLLNMTYYAEIKSIKQVPNKKTFIIV